MLLLLPALLPGRARGGEVPEGAQESESPPNVVVLLADDLGYGDLGFTGNALVRTPCLDAFAEEGARLDAFYVSPFCGPTRAALLTGHYPHRVGVHSNGAELSASAVTFAELLRDAGYATGIFGKWHLGAHHPRRAMDQGFEASLVSRGGFVGELAPLPDGLGQYSGPWFERDGERVQLDGYATAATFDACLDWIERVHEEGRPFLAYVPTNVPHRPWDDVPLEAYRAVKARLAGLDPAPVEDAEELDQLARVYAMIEDLDAQIGRLFARLETLGVLDDTLVLFLSDNGPNGPRPCAGFRGMKGSVYEGGLRSVFLARGPGIASGARSGRATAHVDLLPTLLDACGVRLPDELVLDGRSALPLLQGEDADGPERLLFFEGHKGSEPAPRHNFAVRGERWKLVRSGIGLPMRRGPANANEAPSLEGAELFDLVADPFETRDLLADEPEVARAMRDAYEVLAREMDAILVDDAHDGRVRVGIPEEDPVLLMHERWGLLAEEEGSSKRHASTQDDALMGLRSMEAASYDVTLRFEPPDEAARAFLLLREVGRKRGGVIERTAEVPAGATEVAFDELELEAARYELLAVVGKKRPTASPVWQVELRRRR